MPTGYTAAIADGITFETFAWNCARAFGALIMQRDEASDGKQPAEMQPSDFYTKELESARARLAELQAMTPEQTEASAAAEYEREVARNAEYEAKANTLRAKYGAMLAHVKAWNPPTADHVGMKEFMIKQIEESIHHDCDTTYYDRNPPVRLSGKEWHEKAHKDAFDRVARYAAEEAKEIARVAGRNQWIRALAESLT